MLVGVKGFEPSTPASRRRCSTRLSYTPTWFLDRLKLYLKPLMGGIFCPVPFGIG